MAEIIEGSPEARIARVQWLGALLLDALATIGLKLVPYTEGTSCHDYISALKSVIRSPKADLN